MSPVYSRCRLKRVVGSSWNCLFIYYNRVLRRSVFYFLTLDFCFSQRLNYSSQILKPIILLQTPVVLFPLIPNVSRKLQTSHVHKLIWQIPCFYLLTAQKNVPAGTFTCFRIQSASPKRWYMRTDWIWKRILVKFNK